MTGINAATLPDGGGGMSNIRQRSPVEQQIDKAKEWFLDRANVCMSHVASDRTSLMFYGGIGVLCIVIVAIFTADREMKSGFDGGPIQHHGPTGIMMGTTSEGKPIPETLLQPVPKNVNIAFIGDSISRYSYLSLVYFLRWGRWFEPTLEKSNLVCEVSFKSPFHDNQLAEFFFQTGRMIQPNELCDCYKQTDENDADHLRHIENRFFHDPKLNNTVTFIHAYGHELALHGRIKPDEAHDQSKWNFLQSQNGLLNHQYKEPTWEYDDWADMVTSYLGSMKPKPDHVIVNAGQFSNNFGNSDGKSKETSKKFADALKNLGVKSSVWRTTTYQKGGGMLGKGQEDTDKHMCGLLSHCLDVKWTKGVVDFLYWDDRHFYEPVYRAMNEQLLETIGYLPRGYTQKIRKEKIIKGYVDESQNEYVFHMDGIDDEDDDDAV